MIPGAGLVLAGIVISGFGFAVHDSVVGEVLLLAGVTVGDVGVLAVILVYAVNSEQ